MKFNLVKSLVAAAAFVAVGAANAAAPLTLNVGESITAAGWTVSNLTGSGTLTFSGDLTSGLVGALNAGTVVVEPIAPATGQIEGALDQGGYTKVAVAAVVTSLTGTFDGTTVTVGSVGTAGGAQQTSYDDGFTNTGGALAIQNLRVDLGAKVVYADLIGGNGVGTKSGIALWNIGKIDGPVTFTVNDAVNGVITAENTLSQLSITDEAFGYFVNSLGIIAGGLPVLQGITDYGTIKSTISVNVTQAVPEPSTYALMGVGLVGIGLMARRRAK
jgi:hypothetical protein